MVYEHSILKCPVCGSTNIIFDHVKGEYVCASCGTVISDHVIDSGKEWRTFSPYDALLKSRTGRSLTYAIHDMGLTTTFSTKGFKHSSRVLKKKARDLIRIQNKMRISRKDRVKVTGLKYLNSYASTLQLPNHVREEAARILHKALDKLNVKEKTIKAMAAAAILMACKIHGVPKTLRSIARELGFSEGDIWKAEKKILSVVKKVNTRIVEPKDFIPLIVKKLGLSSQVQYLAAYLTYLARKKDIGIGRGPIGLAAASVYIASILLDEKKTQQEVAEACNITDVTIRNRYSDIVENFDIEVYL